MSPKLYTKRPVTIEAMQFDGNNAQEIVSWVKSNGARARIWSNLAFLRGKGVDRLAIIIDTLEGGMYAHQGDFIIKGVKNEFYPCKPDIFELTCPLPFRPKLLVGVRCDPRRVTEP